MSSVVKELPSQHHAGRIHGDDGLQSLRGDRGGVSGDGQTETGGAGESGRSLSYVASSEGEHGQEDDGQFGFWHFGADGGEDGHDGSRLRTHTHTAGETTLDPALTHGAAPEGLLQNTSNSPETFTTENVGMCFKVKELHSLCGSV